MNYFQSPRQISKSVLIVTATGKPIFNIHVAHENSCDLPLNYFYGRILSTNKILILSKSNENSPVDRILGEWPAVRSVCRNVPQRCTCDQVQW